MVFAMATRRSVLIAASALSIGLGLAAPSSSRAETNEQVTGFVDKLCRDLLGVVNGAGSLPEKQVRLTQIIDASVDVQGVAQFCLGRFWRTATPSQQKDYLALFHQMLVRNLTGKLGDFQGVTYSLGQTQPKDGAVAVGSVVTRPNAAPANVQWLVAPIGGSLKVTDVIAEGTSLRLTQRSDFASFLSSHGDNVQALIDALRQQQSRPSST